MNIQFLTIHLFGVREWWITILNIDFGTIYDGSLIEIGWSNRLIIDFLYIKPLIYKIKDGIDFFDY